MGEQHHAVAPRAATRPAPGPPRAPGERPEGAASRPQLVIGLAVVTVLVLGFLAFRSSFASDEPARLDEADAYLAAWGEGDFATMAAGVAQVKLFSDDGICVHDPLVMRRALEYANGLGVLIAQHAEEPRLTVGAVAHEGPNAAKLGLAGWPRAAEESIVARDALLARDAGARVHICHASTAGTVEIIKWAKQQGISISAEVTPHHLLLDDSRLASYDGVNRVNPPLREAADTQALRRALADGVLDCVATDHAPHAEHEKCCEFSNARPGMLGLQTALSVVVQTMVEPGLLDWRGVARVMSENPARIVGLDDQGRPLEVGEPANLVIVDPDATWIVEGRELASRSANTPYASMTLPARVTATLLRGTVTARDGKSPAV